MSEEKTMELKFNGKVVTVPIFPTYNDCISAFIKIFNIDENKKQNLSLFYYDEENDQISFNLDEDYKLFIDNENLTEKTIEGELLEKDKESGKNELEEPDPLASGHIFKKKVPEQHIDLSVKGLDSSSNLGNSLFSIDSLNNNLATMKRKSNNDDEIINGINQINNMVHKTLEENDKESMIEKMKKEMEI